MSSNILSVFNPPPSRDLTPEENKDCLPCQLLGGFGALVGGTYLATGWVFRGEKPGINGPGYKMCVRGLGVGVIGWGFYRLGMGFLWQRDREYKPYF